MINNFYLLLLLIFKHIVSSKSKKKKSNYKIYNEKDNKSKPALFTPWSIIHLLSGAALEGIFRNRKYSFIYALVIHTIYEIKDFILTYSSINEQNTLTNSIGDTIAMIFGFLISNIFLYKIPVHYLMTIYIIGLLTFYNNPSLEPES